MLVGAVVRTFVGRRKQSSSNVISFDGDWLDKGRPAATLQKAAALAGFRGEYYFFEEGLQAKGFPATYYVDITRILFTELGE